MTDPTSGGLVGAAAFQPGEGRPPWPIAARSSGVSMPTMRSVAAAGGKVRPERIHQRRQWRGRTLSEVTLGSATRLAIMIDAARSAGVAHTTTSRLARLIASASSRG